MIPSCAGRWVASAIVPAVTTNNKRSALLGIASTSASLVGSEPEHQDPLAYTMVWHMI